MKLSPSTIAILKNFQQINYSLTIKKGSILSTISPSEDIIAFAEIEETFPMDFGIYDLSTFLGNLTTFVEPVLEFDEKFVEITDASKISLKYYSVALEILSEVPLEDDLAIMDEHVYRKTISSSVLNKILRIANMNKLQNIVVHSDGSGETYISALNVSEDTSNSATLSLGKEPDTKEFRAVFKKDNLKFVDDDYEVSIFDGAFGKFKSLNKKVTYYVGVESE